MTEMAYGSVGTVDGEAVLSRWWRTLDKSVLTAVLILFSIGLLLGLASSPPLAEKNGLAPFHYVYRQAIFGSLALFSMAVFSMLPSKAIRRLGVIGFLLCFVALGLLPFFGTDFGKGAVRWYGLGFASVQPSEFLKPGFIVTVAWLISASHQINGAAGRLWSFIITMLVVALLIIQPDFGQACLILFGWGIVYFVAGASFILLAALALMVLAAGSIAYSYSDHFAKRIDGFLSPDIDPRTQLGYATNAIQEGGFFGVGVGEGQVKWSLPDAHTDFIISVAAEEYGLLLVVLIILLFTWIVLASLIRLLRETDAFNRLAGSGLVAMFGIQAIINVGVAVRLLPAKGMTLPFVSYGGSSIIAMGITVGMLLALTRVRPQKDIGDIFNGR
ncbi:MAG: putative lipid II flippase FtsW [Rhodobacterales bacterium]|nr:putative lipid II flippase FtsW [Rhodobacterales bacterium]